MQTNKNGANQSVLLIGLWIFFMIPLGLVSALIKGESQFILPEIQSQILFATSAYMFLTAIFMIAADYIIKRKIHIVQYVLLLLAQINLTVLMSGIGNHLDFKYAYLISVGATIMLIVWYFYEIYGTYKGASCFAVFQLILYGLFYIGIQRPDAILLACSSSAFVLLASLMYYTRAINSNGTGIYTGYGYNSTVSSNQNQANSGNQANSVNTENTESEGKDNEE